MAILSMDQVAQLIADRLSRAGLVHDPADIAAAQRAGLIPVLAPHAWMRRVDALPHSWDVTSDSIAAFIAQDGESNWLEGAILLVLYALIGVAFFFVR